MRASRIVELERSMSAEADGYHKLECPSQTDIHLIITLMQKTYFQNWMLLKIGLIIKSQRETWRFLITASEEHHWKRKEKI